MNHLFITTVTYGGPQLSRQNKVTALQTLLTAKQSLLTAKQNLLTAKQNLLTAKQRKRVGQRLLFTLEMVRRVTVTHCSLEKPPFFELTMFCSACGSLVFCR